MQLCQTQNNDLGMWAFRLEVEVRTRKSVQQKVDQLGNLQMHWSTAASFTPDSTDASHPNYSFIPLTRQLSCRNILDRPSYGMIVSSICCTKWVVNNYCASERLEISCLCCHSHSLDRASIPWLVLSLLFGLLVKCEKGLVNYRNHIDWLSRSPRSTSRHTLKSDVVAKPVTTHATPAEVRHLDTRQWDRGANSESSNSWPGQFDLLYMLRQHIQAITLVPLSGCRISSSEASIRILKLTTLATCSVVKSSAQLQAEIQLTAASHSYQLLYPLTIHSRDFHGVN